jgi:hypothetical protein
VLPVTQSGKRQIAFVVSFLDLYCSRSLYHP